jgi:hypothetical protein
MQRQDFLDPNTVEALTVTHGVPTDVVINDEDGEHHAIRTDEHYGGRFSSRTEAISRISGKQIAVFPRANQDRAAVVAVAIEQIFATAQGRERRQALEDYIRTEFAEVRCQAVADWEPVDA